MAEVVEGMQFDRGYISPYMVTDTDKMEAVIDDALHFDHRQKDLQYTGNPAAFGTNCTDRQETG